MSDTLLTGRDNRGPYVDGVALDGGYGLFLAMYRQARHDCIYGEWYARFEAAHWLVYVMPNLLAEIFKGDGAKLRTLVHGTIPAPLIAIAGCLDTYELNALASLVATNGADDIALAYLHDWNPERMM